MTLLLTRSDILDQLDPPAVLDALRTGFRHPADTEPLRIRTPSGPARSGDFLS